MGSCPAPLCRSLTDPSAYVRKTGVMGILKLYHLAPDMVKSSNMVDLLYNMIQDPDAQVRQERSHGEGGHRALHLNVMLLYQSIND